MISRELCLTVFALLILLLTQPMAWAASVGGVPSSSPSNLRETHLSVVQLLQSQHAPAELNARITTLLAEALAGQVNFGLIEVQWVAEVLAQQMTQRPLPEGALTSLRTALENQAMSNRSGVINRHQKNGQLHETLLALYAPDNLDDFALRYAADPTIDIYFRSSIVRQLGQSTAQSMSAELRQTLKAAAEGTSNYQLISSISSARQAHGAPIPLIVKLKTKSNQSQLLSVLWVLCVLVVVVTGIILLLAALRTPLQQSSRKLKRGLLVLVWVAVAIVMVVLLVYAFVGFIGHNKAPAPAHTLKFNVPLYVGTVILAVLATMSVKSRWSKQKG
jgi:ABC-type sugar transport system permease subunit